MNEILMDYLKGLTTRKLEIIAALMKARIANDTKEIVTIVLNIKNDDDLHAVSEAFRLAADEPEGGEAA